MSSKCRIDSAGRLVIPKELRDRYGLNPGSEMNLVPVPDGITLVPSRTEHSVVRRGRVVAIDTGTTAAPAAAFDISSIRSERLDRKSGISQ